MLIYKLTIFFFFFFVVGLSVFMFYLYGSPYERGFFCGDESIRYPFKESTVSSFFLHLVGLGLPTLVVSNAL